MFIRTLVFLERSSIFYKKSTKSKFASLINYFILFHIVTYFQMNNRAFGMNGDSYCKEWLHRRASLNDVSSVSTGSTVTLFSQRTAFTKDASTQVTEKQLPKGSKGSVLSKVFCCSKNYTKR